MVVRALLRNNRHAFIYQPMFCRRKSMNCFSRVSHNLITFAKKKSLCTQQKP